ncbi:MAG: glycosyltransferase [Syntrophales bacterium]
MAINKDDKINYFNSLAGKREKWLKRGDYYHRAIANHIKFLIPAGSSILQIGCGIGNLIASLDAARKVGIDFSQKMIEVAKEKFPGVEFRVDDLEDLQTDEKFDYILLVNVIGYVDDIQSSFAGLKKICKPDTRIIVVYFNYLWQPILKFAEWFGLRMRRPIMHWLPPQDIRNILKLSDFETVKADYQILMPVYIPVISTLLNRVIAKIPFFRKLALNEIVIARTREKREDRDGTTCSVVIPCRNEKGNIENAVQRTPDMGKHTEIIFVEGHSQDGTLAECLRVQKAYPDRDIQILVQDGKGKADAVRKGFQEAKGDVLMILDADLTIPPESLPKFFEAIVSGKGELVIGSRLVYQMEKEAMRTLNLLGNKFFSTMFTYLLEQRIRDTLCGTKVLRRRDYEKIVTGRSYFGDFDPFGDFDLLFGAAKLNLQIVEIPIKYRERTYGSTQISRFRHGWLLLKMTAFAMKKIKFI